MRSILAFLFYLTFLSDAAIKAILCQLKSSEQKTVELSMAMLETLMKNCKSVPYLITRPVMEEIVNIAMGRRGARNQDEALRLIQSWGRTFEKRKNELPIFFDTFMNLKSKGVQFPNLDPQDIVASPTSVPKEYDFPISHTYLCLARTALSATPQHHKRNNLQSFNKT